ncbi:Ribosome maturation factor RimP [Thiorhodovibrio winogradskyi]|uniref:Ribosome maturation factor RimP n=1 Tax=Thiorhodovibrio winogradskyi TaxID=77007 RepID=A0ABZ0S7K0_9GAMM|nr:ribosome maturation factor RimP [Thiorhodovibrio winogradskyi]
MYQANPKLTALAGAVVEPLGFELVGVEQCGTGRSSVVRVYIDHEEGITVDDCALVSHQLSGQLDVEDPIPGEYALEVSSPGLDRPLFTAEQMQRFQGQRARVRLAEKRNGRRNFEGVLAGVINDALQLRLDNDEMESLSLALIESARLVPQF